MVCWSAARLASNVARFGVASLKSWTQCRSEKLLALRPLTCPPHIFAARVKAKPRSQAGRQRREQRSFACAARQCRELCESLSEGIAPLAELVTHSRRLCVYERSNRSIAHDVARRRRRDGALRGGTAARCEVHATRVFWRAWRKTRRQGQQQHPGFVLHAWIQPRWLRRRRQAGACSGLRFFRHSIEACAFVRSVPQTTTN